jgi:hypothetical protein
LLPETSGRCTKVHSLHLTDNRHYSLHLTDNRHYSLHLTDNRHYSLHMTDSRHYSLHLTDNRHYSLHLTDNHHYSLHLTDNRHYSLHLTEPTDNPSTHSGTFAPSTDLGKVIVVGYGTIAMAIFGISLGIMGNAIDALVTMIASRLLMVYEVSEKRIKVCFLEREGFYEAKIAIIKLGVQRREARMLHSRMVSSLCVLNAFLAICAEITYVS